MSVIWGLVISALALLCWGGQALSLFAPDTAARLSLTERPGDVEAAFHADVRGEAVWDFLTLWTLLAAGVLLTVGSAAWPYFGLIGGAMYVYFAGRGVLTRREMTRRRLRIGNPANVWAAFVMLPVFGAAGLVTLIAAVYTLT